MSPPAQSSGSESQLNDGNGQEPAREQDADLQPFESRRRGCIGSIGVKVHNAMAPRARDFKLTFFSLNGPVRIKKDQLEPLRDVQELGTCGLPRSGCVEPALCQSSRCGVPPPTVVVSR